MKRIALFLSIIFLLSHVVRAQTVDSLWNGYLSPFVQTGGTMPNFTVQGQFVSNGGFTGAQISLPLKPRLIVYSSNKCYELPFTALTSTGSIIAGTVTDPSGTLSAIPSGSAIIFQPSSVYHVGPFPTGISASLQGCMQTYNNLKIDSIQTGGITPGDKQDIDVVSTNVWVIDTNAVTTIKIAANAVDSNKIATLALPINRLAQSGATNGQVLKWNTTLNKWVPGTDNGTSYLAGPGISIVGNLINNDAVLSINGEIGDVTDVMKTTDPLGGDVSGTVDAVSVDKIAGQPLSGDTPATGEVLKWNGTSWDPAVDGGGGGSGPDSTFKKTNDSYYTQINDNIYKGGTLGLRTTDTTGVLNIVRPSSDTKFGIYLGGNQQNLWKVQKTTSATTEISDFNFTRSIFPSVSTAGDNQVFTFGLNGAGGGGVADITKAAMYIAFENNFRNAPTDAKSFEFHNPQIFYPSGAGRRPMSGYFSNDESDIRGHIGFTSDFFNINDYKTQSQKVTWGFATNSIYPKGIVFADTAIIKFGLNNVGGLTQRNAANSADINMIKANSSNEVILGESNASRIVASNNLHISGGALFTGASNQILIGNSTYSNRLIIESTSDILRLVRTGATYDARFDLFGTALRISNSTSNNVFNMDLGAPGSSIRITAAGLFGNGTANPQAQGHFVSLGGNTAKMLRLENSVGSSDVYRTNATPQSAITANPGDLALSNISSTGSLWIKKTGTGPTGWEQAITTPGTSTSITTLMREESFTATAAQTAFTIAYTAPAVSGTSVPLRVYRNGVRLFWVASGPTTAQFTYSGTTVTTLANDLGDIITVEYLN